MTEPASVFEVLGNYRTDVRTRLVNGGESGTTTINRYVRQPDWVSPYQLSDVTYPMVLNLETYVFGNTGAQTAGTAHTHPISATATATAGFGAIPANNAIGSYLTITQNAQYNNFQVAIYTDTLVTGGTVLFQIFRELEDGSLTRMLSEDIGASLTTSTQIIGVTVPGGMVVREGERYVIRVANFSSPTRTVRLGGLDATTAGPFIRHTTLNSTDTNKTTLTAVEAASAQVSGTIVIWAVAAGDDPPPEDRTYWDDFNRVNLGPSWAWDTIALGAVGELVISGGRMVYSGSDGVAESKFIHPVTSDSMRIDFDAHDVAGTDADDTYLGAMVCYDREAFTGVAVVVNTEKAYIFSRNTTWTQRASVATTGNNVTWSLYYDEATNTYTVLKNGDDISLSWTDSGDVIPHGANYRYAAIQISQDSSVPGGQIDNFVFRDWTP